jgi:hypothetical protein
VIPPGADMIYHPGVLQAVYFFLWDLNDSLAARSKIPAAFISFAAIL